MKRTQAPAPFEEYWVYPPILHKKEGRKMVVLVPMEKTSGIKRTSTSYARYLLSVKLGRRLLSSEEVDHIDENKLNDSIGNLQILSPEGNREKYAKARVTKAVAILRCPWCHKIFERSRRQTHLGKGRGVFTSCSRSCAGKLRRELQLGCEYKFTEDVSKNLVRIEHR